MGTLIINIFVSNKVINLHISYTLNPWLRYLNRDFTFNNFNDSQMEAWEKCLYFWIFGD